jgi:hypothetical protein
MGRWIKLEIMWRARWKEKGRDGWSGRQGGDMIYDAFME